MPLLDREILVDRPVLVDRGESDDNQGNQTAAESEDAIVETLGEGGGPVMYGLEFEPGDYEVVTGANAAAVLSTGQTEGQAFEQSFTNAALQLKDLIEHGDSIKDVSRFALENGIGNIGLSEKDINMLRENSQQRSEPEEVKEVQEVTEIQEPSEDGVKEEPDGAEDVQDEEAEDEEDEESDDVTIEEIEEDIEEVKEDTDG